MNEEKIMRMLRSDDEEFKKFGEIYFLILARSNKSMA